MEWTTYEGPKQIGPVAWEVELCPSCAMKLPAVIGATELYYAQQVGILAHAAPVLSETQYEALIELGQAWNRADSHRLKARRDQGNSPR